MTSQTEKAARFLELHQPGSPLLLPNPWDQGSAKLLAALGFQSLATTSSGFAATLGRSDGSVSRTEALEHAAAIVAATDLPVSADLENCFADDPDGVAQTVALAVGTGLAGCSVEDFTGNDDEPIYDIGLAAERVAAAAQAAHAGPVRLVLTARAENYLYGRSNLADTITRLQAYQAAGADVLYAPGLTSLADIRQLVSEVDRPVNVLAMPGTPPVSELAGAGVSRVSVGGALAFAALGALVDAATELRDNGTYSYLAGTAVGRQALKGIALAKHCHPRALRPHGSVHRRPDHASGRCRTAAFDVRPLTRGCRQLAGSGVEMSTAIRHWPFWSRCQIVASHTEMLGPAAPAPATSAGISTVTVHRAYPRSPEDEDSCRRMVRRARAAIDRLIATRQKSSMAACPRMGLMPSAMSWASSV
jgi:2-methylisocitrate lyase-like PEP mutase family enzyme